MKSYLRLLFSSIAVVCALLSPTIVQGQTYLIDEGFEGQAFPPSGWKIIDGDGDGNNWQIAVRGDATLNGTQTAISYGYDVKSQSSLGEQSNYLITPKIHVTNDAFNLAFIYCAQDLDSEETFEVRISETGNEIADFTNKMYSETVDNGYEDDVVKQSFSRSLADYVGKDIYIAFVYKGGGYALSVEDVKVTNQKGPKPVTKFTVTPGEKGALTAALQWTNPSTDATNAAITELAIGIYRDGRLIKALSGEKPGEVSAYTDMEASAGSHVYSLIAKTAEGESKPVSKTAWIGEDIPAAVGDLQAVMKQGVTTITWTAPAEGANKGYIDPTKITYNIVRNDDNGSVTLKEGLVETSFSDKAESGVLHSYSVVPANVAGKGAEAISNAVISFSEALKDITAGADGKDIGNYAPRIPLDPSSRYQFSQSMYYPIDLMYAKGDIKYIVYENSFNSALSKPVKIYLAETDKENLADGWIPLSEMTLVYDGTVKFSKGQNDVPIELSTPYSYGGKNLVVCMQMDYVKEMGGYFDRFVVRETADKPDRTRTYTSSREIDFASITAADGDKEAAIPLTRFVIAAKEVAGLSGKVTAAGSGDAVVGAKVEIPALGMSATSGEDGRYSFYVVPSGKQSIKITANGYDDYTTDVTVQDGGEQTADFSIKAKAKISVSGIVKADDTNAALEGVKVVAAGYSEVETATNSDGKFQLEVYAGEKYSISVEKPLYNVARYEVEDTKDYEIGEVVLKRSLIAAYGVSATIDAEGSAATVEWKDPLSRTGENKWTQWGKSMFNEGSTGGDYSATDYNVAHAFTSQDIADSLMVGQSILRMRVFLKAESGKFTARVWKGTRDENVVVASQPIPLEKISKDGAWVTVDFDHPAEIKEGENYLVGVNLDLEETSSSVVGHAGFGTSISGKNNLKWSDNPDDYVYDGYYAWNISAYCGVPGADLPVSETDGAPKSSYNVYRIAASEPVEEVKLNDSPLQTTSFVDGNWDILLSGKYVYAVKALYKSGESIYAYSDTLERAVNTDAGISAFVSPVKSKDLQTSVEVKVSIKNYGEKPLTSVPVAFTVNGGTPVAATFEGNIAKGETADMVLGTVDVSKQGTYTIEAYTSLEGDEVKANDKLAFVLPNFENVDLRGYRWDAYGYAGMMKINSNVPEQAEFIKEVTPDNNLVNAGEYHNGRFYAYTSTWYSAPQSFVEMDTITWNPTKSFATEEFIQDMAYDYYKKRMLGLRISGDYSDLVTIDLSNGQTTLIGNTGVHFYALSCNKDGQIYAISGDGGLYKIDGTTAQPSLVGDTGVDDVTYLQSMAFDHNSGRLFWARTGNFVNGELYEVNPETAEVTSFGRVMYGVLASEIVALYSVYDDNGGVDAATVDGNKLSVSVEGKLLSIKLSAPDGKTATAKIYNMAGVVVKAVGLAAETTTVAVDFPAGVYAVVATASDGTVYKSDLFVVR